MQRHSNTQYFHLQTLGQQRLKQNALIKAWARESLLNSNLRHTRQKLI